jgi:hypothetical protein
MISSLRDGNPVDVDALRDELIKAAKANGASGRVIGQLMGRARYTAERARRLEENRGDEAPDPLDHIVCGRCGNDAFHHVGRKVRRYVPDAAYSCSECGTLFYRGLG